MSRFSDKRVSVTLLHSLLAGCVRCGHNNKSVTSVMNLPVIGADIARNAEFTHFVYLQ